MSGRRFPKVAAQPAAEKSPEVAEDLAEHLANRAVCICIVGCAPEYRIHAEGCPCRLCDPQRRQPYP